MALQEGSIDIGLVGLPPKTDMTENNMLTYLPLKTIEDIFVATESYLVPFGTKYKGETHKEEGFFQEAAFIMLDKENISRKHVDLFLNENHITLSNVIEVNNMDLSIEFAK